MAINKPTKPDVTLPDSFGGVHTAYTDTQIQDGYEDGIPQIVDGGNVNYEKDGLFKNNKYNRTVTDVLVDMPQGNILTVDSNNRFDYIKNGNAGEILTANGAGQLPSFKPAIIPSQTGNAGKFLTTNGTTTSWDNALSYDTISNCILENPKLVDLSVSGSNITLEAGSKVIVPYGKSAPTMSIGQSLNGGTITDISWDGINLFYYVSYTEITREKTGNEHLLCFISNEGSFVISQFSIFLSSDTQPSSSGGIVWYDTNNNIIKMSTDGGSTWSNYQSLPFADITTNGTIININKIFDVMFFIGGYKFIAKGATFLIPNGINSDGSYKSIYIKTPYVRRLSNISGWHGEWNLYVDQNGGITQHPRELYFEQTEEPISNASTLYWYNPDTNVLKYKANNVWNVRTFLYLGYYTETNGNVTSLNTRRSFRVADYYEKVDLDLSNVNASGKSNVVNWGMPNYSSAISITSGYVAPTDGFIRINMYADNNTNSISINGVNVFDINASGQAYISVGCFIPVSANDTIVFTGSSAVFFPAKGV